MKSFFKNLGSIVKDFATRNWGLKLTALLLAFLVWCGVVASTNPLRIKTVEDVPLNIVGTEELEAKGLCLDTSLSDIPDSISVNIKAGIDYHLLLTNTSVSASINLASIKEAGEVNLNVLCTLSSVNGTVTQIFPSSVKLIIDELVTRTVPVTCKLTQSPKEGYYVSDVKLRNDEITIKGPKSKVSQVSKAVAYVDASEIKETESISVPATFLDIDGDELQNITLDDNDNYCIVDVDVLPVKEIAITEQMIENAIINIAPGYEVYGAASTPMTFRIAAPQKVLDKINTVQLELIDAHEADKSIVTEAIVKDIDNTRFIDGDKISVYLQIREIQEEVTFKNLEVEIHGGNEKSAILNSERVDVTVKGDRSIVSKLKKDDIHPYVELNGSTGEKVMKGVYVADIAGIDSANIAVSPENVYVIKK